MFGLVRVGVKPPEGRRKAGPGTVSTRTFLIMIGFFVSVCGFVLLLSLIGLNDVTFNFK